MTPRKRDARFYQLLDLAREGDEPAIHELWLTYRFDFEREPDPRDRQPTKTMSETANNKKKEE